jgi:hypothetical protein
VKSALSENVSETVTSPELIHKLDHKSSTNGTLLYYHCIIGAILRLNLPHCQEQKVEGDIIHISKKRNAGVSGNEFTSGRITLTASQSTFILRRISAEQWS